MVSPIAIVEDLDNGDKVSTVMAPKAILQCRPNSHPFPERTLILDQPVKVGRSVARARPARDNAIFDCKVLSRNHAVLWYENGKFLLQDTKSSNGTFVNNQRLSKGSEESAPREICSGDVVQYGVDVMENSRKGSISTGQNWNTNTDNTVTHGCIIATLKLYMPDGQEAKASSFTSTGDGSISISAQDLLQLKTCLEEAQHKESVIESKLVSLKLILKNTQEASFQSWTAMIDEDRLLQRLENLEAQLITFVKNYPEEASREEIKRILEEKNTFETTAKESIQKILKEKTETLVKFDDYERELTNTKDELKYIKEVADSSQRDLEELLAKQAAQSQELEELTKRLKNTEEKLEESSAANQSDWTEQTKFHEAEKERLVAEIESLKAENDFTKEQLSSIKAKYENIKNGKLNMANMFVGDVSDTCLEESEIEKKMQMLRTAVNSLQERLWQTEEELHQTKSCITQLKNEAELADKVDSATSAQKNRLQDELNDKKIKEEANSILIDHLQSQLGIFELRLRNIDPDSCPKIYEDIYDDNISTLGRYKKKKDNKDDFENSENQKSMDEDDDLIGDTTLISEIQDKNNINESEKINFPFDPESLIYLKEDIIKIQEILFLAESSKSSAEEELNRIRDEYGKASTNSITTAHEAANLHRQLAANEAVLLEKTRYVSTLQEVSGQLESSLELIYSHIIALTSKVSKEREESAKAKTQVTDLSKKLEEAELFCKESFVEAEKLRAKIDQLVEAKNAAEIATERTKSIQENSSVHGINRIEEINQSSQIVEEKSLLTDEGTKPVEESSLSSVVPELENEISRLKKAYDELKEKEGNLRNQLASREIQEETKVDANQISSRNDLSQDDKNVLKVQNELQKLCHEHQLLKEKLILSDGMFADLNLQNKMTIPTWLLFLLVSMLAVGWDSIVSVIFGYEL